MIVYAVIENDYECAPHEGLFLNKEKADQRCAQLLEEYYARRFGFPPKYKTAQFVVEEWEVDESE